MYPIHLRRFLVPLACSGLLALSGCSSPAPTDTKAAPEKTASSELVQPPKLAEVEAAPAPAPKPSRNENRAAAPAPKSAPPAPAPQAAPAPVTPPAPEPPPPAPQVAPPVAVQPAPPPPAPIPVVDTKDVTIPSGTNVTITMIDSVDSGTAHVGDTFRASIDQPLTIDGDVVLQKGAEAVVRLTDVASAGDLKGQSRLQLVLDHVTVGKRNYTVDTNVFEESGAEQSKKTVRNGALGAAIGAAIGAIAGGGKGAAIGGAAGAGGGVGATAVMKGEQVRVASETKLMFTLQRAVNVTINPGLPPSVSRATAVSAPQRDRFSTQPQQADPNQQRPRVRRYPNYQ